MNIPIAERENGTKTNIIIRGVQPASRQLRPDFKIVAGRDFVEGKGECIVSKRMSARFKGAQVGGRLVFGPKEIYNVVGIFTAGGSAAESEIWADLKDVEKNTGRDGSVSCVQLRAASAADYDKLKQTIDDENRFRLAAIPESVYFETQSRSSIFLKGAGTLIAVLLTFGAMFSSANTMFAAVSARTREIGTMRALGFSQFDILISFLGESLLLCGARRRARLAGDHSPQRLDLRDQRLQQLCLGHRRLPLRTAGPGRRPRDDAGHGPLRRHVPRAAGRAAGCHLGAARVMTVDRSRVSPTVRAREQRSSARRQRSRGDLDRA